MLIAILAKVKGCISVANRCLDVKMFFNMAIKQGTKYLQKEYKKL